MPRNEWAATVRKAAEDHRGLAAACAASLTLLLIFLVLQGLDASLLGLESKWLLVASLPILVALISGGYIRKFKGFGVELETSLEGPVSTVDLEAASEIDLEAAAAMDEELGEAKRSVDRLHQMPPKTRGQITRLVFQTGRRSHYAARAVGEYLRALPMLKYLEIRRAGALLCMLPATAIQPQGAAAGPPGASVEAFIEALEEDTVEQQFQGSAVVQSIRTRTPLVDALTLLVESRLAFLPVLSD